MTSHRIAILANLYPPLAPGGAEAVTRDHAQALACMGHEVVVITTTGRVGIKPAVTERLDGVVRVLTVNGWNAYHTLKRPRGRWLRVVWFALDLFNPVMSRRVSRLIEEIDPDVILAENLWNFSTQTVATLSRRTPLVLFLHDAALFCVRGTQVHRYTATCQRSLACRALALVRRRQLRNIYVAAAPSQFLLQAFRQSAIQPRMNCRVIANRLAHEPNEVTPRCHDVNYLYVGQLAPHKGMSVLRLLLSHIGPGETLTVIGSGEPDVIQELQDVPTSGRLRLLGKHDLDGIYREMANATLMVLPSLWPENAPRVILEGQAAGMPFVAFRTGGVPELLTDGVDSVLVEPYDAGAFVEATIELGQDGERQSIFRKGAKRAARARSSTYEDLGALLCEAAEHRAGRNR